MPTYFIAKDTKTGQFLTKSRCSVALKKVGAVPDLYRTKKEIHNLITMWHENATGDLEYNKILTEELEGKLKKAQSMLSLAQRRDTGVYDAFSKRMHASYVQQTEAGVHKKKKLMQELNRNLKRARDKQLNTFEIITVVI